MYANEMYVPNELHLYFVYGKDSDSILKTADDTICVVLKKHKLRYRIYVKAGILKSMIFIHNLRDPAEAIFCQSANKSLHVVIIHVLDHQPQIV